MKNINYKSDFDCILTVKDCKGNDIGFPDFDFEAKFYTRNFSVYMVSSLNGVLTNCFNDNGKIHCVFQNHKLGPGKLMVEFHSIIPDSIYTDEVKDIYSPQETGITLISGKGDCTEDLDIDIIPNFIKLNYDDLTPEQIAELQRPAKDAAQEVYTLQEQIIKKEEKREFAERERITDEETRENHERLRTEAENTRLLQEGGREINEQERIIAEQKRVIAEDRRKTEFATFEEKIENKQDKLLTTDDFRLSENVLSLTDKAKKKLFIDLWTSCYDCTYNEIEVKPFVCNELPLTYEEAIDVYESPRISYNNMTGLTALTRRPKTIILDSLNTSGNYADISNNIRTDSLIVLRISADNSEAYIINGRHAFYYDVLLKGILGSMNFSQLDKIKVEGMFLGCKSLELVLIKSLKVDISFKDSKVLSYESLLYLIQNATNTTAITITVHADVYAKLTGDTTNEAAAQLTPVQLAQWQELVTTANAKNISFAVL